MTTRMPAIFFGHGNPMNALRRNVWTEGWAELGRKVPRPKAVLCISAHWYLPETAVTAMAQPRTIHDFGGFPPELFQLQYPAPGDAALARRVQTLLAPLPVRLDEDWGLDHGVWSVLCHVFPQADIPVVQLSLDARQPASFHYELGKRLAPLREESVLIAGSGNLIHNLRAYVWGQPQVEAYDWAAHFETQARELMLAGDYASLVAYESLGRDAMLSIPTPEHYLPLLYVLALRRPDDAVSFPVSGVDGGSISMLTVRVG
ncbi:MAG TPA: 4,5-DOPA dioxygenase extradiol [Blastocatellia bacterium]|nr:4,5-DOPA dioxygenase extradiol [Blastocatellia bacterium]HMY71107.1 4,5-DOPA dioxygenase extradiol [Blastocatellia bacterium]HMZ19686.1 4,5-DOPA dioxygenase extradiol [Blastocatellia bacterium]HNG33081.1 4,5-DOPA dioxygenase extradiol [Blastocatellia bacterium]